MISIADKKDCCGCSACAQRCPRHCITMREDEEGFLYPAVDASVCINCGLCERVCPCLHQGKTIKPLAIETAVNPDISVRKKSSSGGIFSLLAEQVLSKGGVVFGAKFNEKWEVEHGFSDSLDGLTAFRGSKYVQSSIGDSYRKAEDFLKEGREVLFSGTPCQITGLRLFLQKDYKSLLTVAIACHSTPSPLVWRPYLEGMKFKDISGINFRDKRFGWEKYGLRIVYDNGREYFQRYDRDPYMQLFLHGLTARPSCFSCPAKKDWYGVDLIIGDCWGVSQILPGFPNDHKGTSFVISMTERGIHTYNTLGIKGQNLSLEQVVSHNGGLTNRSVMPIERSAFWDAFQKIENKQKVILHFARPYLPGFKNKLIRYFKHLQNK